MKIRHIFLLIAVILLIGTAKAVTNDYISYWKLDNQSGTLALDQNTTSNNIGTLINMNPGFNNCTGNCSGWNTTGLAFDGFDDRMDTGNAANLNITGNFTFIFNLTPLSWGGTTNIFMDKSGNGANGYRFLQGGGDIGMQLRAGFATTASALISRTFTPLNAETHIAITWNGSGLILYTNGTQRIIGYGTGITTTTGNLTFGRDNGADLSYSNMIIRNVSIYDRVLNNSEINDTIPGLSGGGGGGNVTLNCTDAGSDGVANNIITVSTSNLTSNCFTNGIDDNIEINMALDNASAISGAVHLFAGLYINGGNTTENNGDKNSTIFVKNNTKFYGNRSLAQNSSSSIIRLRDRANWGLNYSCDVNQTGDYNRTLFGTNWHGEGLIGINAPYAHDIEIFNLTLDSNRANQCEAMDNGSLYTTILIRDGTNISIHDNFFNTSLNDHIRGEDSATDWATGNTNGLNNLTVYNNTLRYAYHSSITFMGAKNSTAHDNDIVTGANAAMRIAYGGRDNTYRSNVIHSGLAVYGIEITCSTGDLENNTVDNNTIYAQGYEGIIIFVEDPTPTGACNGTRITQNRVYQNTFRDVSGIGVYEANNTLVEGNTVYNNGGHGIAVGRYNGNGNAFFDYQYASRKVTTIKNNIVANNTGYGLYLNDAPNNTVINSYNLFYNNTLGDADTNITLGTGTITGQNPLFVNDTWRGFGGWPWNEAVEMILDLHLKSNQTWNATTLSWDTYNVSSPAIGAGDPASDNSRSFWYPTQIRREMGAYGNTLYASEGGALTTPPTPINLTQTNGSFWVNYTWQAGSGVVTDSYNISLINNSVQYWINGTTNLSINSTIGAGNWSNISVWAWNSSGNGNLSISAATMNTQVLGVSPSPTPTTNVSVSSYVQSTCASTLNWGIVGASLITVLLIVVAGGLVFGFLPGNFKMDTFPIQEFALTVIAVVVIGSIGVAIISPIITVIGCP